MIYMGLSDFRWDLDGNVMGNFMGNSMDLFSLLMRNLP